MQFHDLKNIIPKIQEIKLPGLEAQLEMAPSGRSNIEIPFMKSPKKAAVICLLYPDKDHQMHFCLIKRAPYPGVHSDQVGFPGGQLDTTDVSLWATALRELQEELGLVSKNVSQIKTLSPLYIPPSNFWVQPFLGIYHTTPIWFPDALEVSQVIEVPLQGFVHESNIITTQVHSSKGILERVPAYPIEGFDVWGATAMMLAEVKALFVSV